MTQQPAFPPRPGSGVPPNWYYGPGGRTPSGLFPSGPRLFPVGPQRPTYREPHPVRGGAVAAGAGATTAWLLFFGLLGRDLAGYVWWTVLAGGVAWLVAMLLVRVGDRGAAAGVAMVTAVGWSVAVVVTALRWTVSGDWPLW